MALAGRSTRRSGGSRLLVAALVITLLVLLIDASIKSRSTTSVQRLSAETWIDKTLPLIRDSTEQGQQINAVRTDGLKMSAKAIAAQVQQTAAAADKTYQTAKKLVPPSSFGTAGGLLDACLLVRKEAAASVEQTVVATLSGPATPAATNSSDFANAAEKFQSADQLYQLFTQNLPGLGIKMPASVWGSDASLYQTPALAVYLASLRSAKNLTPVHELVVQALSTTPPAERVDGNLQVLPAVDGITVDVTVANEGNQVEDHLTVTATALPAVRNPSAKNFIGPIQPGTSQSLTIGELFPEVGQPITLTVTVTPPAGSATPAATRTLTFEMPSKNTPLTTTTSTTTVPPAGGTPPAGTTPGTNGPTTPPTTAAGTGTGP